MSHVLLVFNVFPLSKSKRTVFEGIFVFEDKRFQRGSFSSVEKGFRRRLHFGSRKRSTLKTLTKKLYRRFHR